MTIFSELSIGLFLVPAIRAIFEKTSSPGYPEEFPMVVVQKEQIRIQER
jgi:hypothetical protein